MNKTATKTWIEMIEDTKPQFLRNIDEANNNAIEEMEMALDYYSEPPTIKEIVEISAKAGDIYGTLETLEYAVDNGNLSSDCKTEIQDIISRIQKV